MSAAPFLIPYRWSAHSLMFCLALQHLSACSEMSPAAGPGLHDDNPHRRLESASLSNPSAHPLTLPLMETAPEIFNIDATVVWDGKPTLQGVWVAHPLATSARRARIFDTDRNRFVDGAVFRLERVDSGALISADAAAALGLSAGEKVNLRVIALVPGQSIPDGAAIAQIPITVGRIRSW